MKQLYLIALILMTVKAPAKEMSAISQKPKLIELFSSEGCSSCPPAEESLAKLVDSPLLWKTFVPVNFHVDYWNRLGWTDPYSKKLFTERQHDYARFWNTDTVYTPAFVVDGDSAGSSLNSSKLNSANSLPEIQFKEQVTQKGEEVSFTVNFENLDSKKKYFVYFTVLANGLESKVTSGENEGKTLKQNFVVLDFQKKKLFEKNIKTVLKFNSKLNYKKLSYAIWVTEEQKMLPLAVSGRYL